ncbi:(Fe-S)-binding protein [Chloroflexota bacterium]
MSKELIPPGLTYLADNITSKDNIMGSSKKEGARWAKDIKFSGNVETIFFAGCGYQFTSELETLMSLIRQIDKSAISTEMTMNLASLQKKLGFDAGAIYRKVMTRGSKDDAQPLWDAVRILNKLGIEFGYLAEDEPCCGGLLYYIGMQKEFGQHALQTYNKLKSRGVKRIISIVPSCTFTLRELMTKYIEGADIEVKHFCEIVAENISSLKLRFPRKVKVTYHDPCQMARSLGLIEEPRKILKSIDNIELVEPEWTKGEWATCCGGGGGFEAVFPELSEVLAENRARELLETGAEIIVTHCPGCVMQLTNGLKKLKAGKVEVLDLAQVVAQAMEE